MKISNIIAKLGAGIFGSIFPKAVKDDLIADLLSKITRLEAKKPTPMKPQEQGARKPGGQTRHKGCALKPREHPDVVIEHKPDTCANCGGGNKFVTSIAVGCKLKKTLLFSTHSISENYIYLIALLLRKNV